MRNASNSRPVALVTGASSGIGRSLAMQLAERGHDLVLTARRLPLLEEAAEEIGKATGAQCDAIRSDLSDVDGAQQLIAEIRRRTLRVSFLVHNSGLTVDGRFLDTAWQQPRAFGNLLSTSPAELIPARHGERREGKKCIRT